MKRLTQTLLLTSALLVIAPADSAASTRRGRAARHAAKCIGSTPCRACKNCRYCKHCAKEGGTCGVCRRAESSKRTWQAAADETSAG